MRRAGRILYNGAVAVSLLLCLGTAGVWVRSYWVGEGLIRYDWPSDRSYLQIDLVESSRGGLRLFSGHYFGFGVPSSGDRHFFYQRDRALRYPLEDTYWGGSIPFDGRRYAALGFELIFKGKRNWAANPNRYVLLTSFTLPYYFPTLVFALLPAHYFFRVRGRRRVAFRRALWCCVFCGYDLRASAGRCSECGGIMTNDEINSNDESMAKEG